MHILYLDESGEPTNLQEQTCFAIAGVAFHEGQIELARQRLKVIQDKYFPNIAIPIVFHATDIKNGKGIYREFSQTVREQILTDLYKVIQDSRYPSLVVFGAAIGIESAENPNQVRSDTFEEVCCGFNSFLVWQHRCQHTSKGLIILDKNKEEQYKQLLLDFRQNGTKYGYLGNIVDIPYFARCHDTPMLQFADLCAYAIHRYYRKNDNSYLNMILPRIYRTIDNKMFGLKHLTKNKSCTCVSCVTQTSL